jgi:hypothetical protein
LYKNDASKMPFYLSNCHQVSVFALLNDVNLGPHLISRQAELVFNCLQLVWQLVAQFKLREPDTLFGIEDVRPVLLLSAVFRSVTPDR